MDSLFYKTGDSTIVDNAADAFSVVTKWFIRMSLDLSFAPLFGSVR